MSDHDDGCPTYDGMMAGLSRLVDWSAIHFAAARVPGYDGRDPRLDQTRECLKSPDFFPPAGATADIRFMGSVRFRFETPRPGDWAENNTVHGRLYRCGGHWCERPVVLLLHGWNDRINHALRFPLMARMFNRHNLNAATLEAPFHFHRRPRRMGRWGNFIGPDILRIVQSVGQSVLEIRTFAAWLREQGCPRLGLLGVSLGGWLGGLAICHDAQFSCAVLLVPVGRLDRVIAETAFCRSIRAATNGRPIEAGKLNLTESRPAIARENILLIEAVHDLFVPVETTEELWTAWEQPEIWRLPHGHLSVLAAWGLNERILHWMTPRLDVPAGK